MDPPRPLARPRPRHVRPVVADWCAEHAARIGDAPAADYLFEELTSAPEGFVTSSATRTFLDKFRRAVDSSAYEADLAGVTDITARRSLVEAWLSSYAASAGVLDDHYAAQAHTLTTGAEANLLKLAELRGTLTPRQTERWTELKAAHVRARTLGGADGDPAVRAVAALGLVADRIAAVESAITRVTAPQR